MLTKKFCLWGVFYLAWGRRAKYLNAETSLRQADCVRSRGFVVLECGQTVISRSLRARELLCFNLSRSTELCSPASLLVDGEGMLLRGYWGVAEPSGNGPQRPRAFPDTLSLTKCLCVHRLVGVGQIEDKLSCWLREIKAEVIG